MLVSSLIAPLAHTITLVTFHQAGVRPAVSLGELNDRAQIRLGDRMPAPIADAEAERLAWYTQAYVCFDVCMIIVSVRCLCCVCYGVTVYAL